MKGFVTTALPTQLYSQKNNFCSEHLYQITFYCISYLIYSFESIWVHSLSGIRVIHEMFLCSCNARPLCCINACRRCAENTLSNMRTLNTVMVLIIHNKSFINRLKCWLNVIEQRSVKRSVKKKTFSPGAKLLTALHCPQAFDQEITNVSVAVTSPNCDTQRNKRHIFTAANYFVICSNTGPYRLNNRVYVSTVVWLRDCVEFKYSE